MKECNICSNRHCNIISAPKVNVQADHPSKHLRRNHKINKDALLMHCLFYKPINHKEHTLFIEELLCKQPDVIYKLLERLELVYVKRPNLPLGFSIIKA